jgi:CheY-like chemotaxis protein/HPt (histidine-containing phosphotransfer) domain-containing protein
MVDRRLGDADGLALARAVRGSASVGETRAVLLATVLDENEEGLAEQGLVDAVLTKPIRPSELTLRTLLGTGQGEDEDVPDLEDVGSIRLSERYDAHVLVAEDNPVNQEVTREMLETLGCRVTMADNGVAAVKALEERAFDLVLMDCQMPEMDGYDATGAVRRRERGEGTADPAVIVALTANALSGDRERCLAAGMDDYLSKPFSISDLQRVLARWITPGEDVAPVAPPPPRSGRADPAALDQSKLDAIRALQRQGAPSVLERVVHLYLESSGGLVESIREAVRAQNAEALRQAAHSLKSASANLGASRLAELCKNLEEMGRQNQTQTARPLLVEVETVYPLVCRQLQDECGQLGG